MTGAEAAKTLLPTESLMGEFVANKIKNERRASRKADGDLAT